MKKQAAVATSTKGDCLRATRSLLITLAAGAVLITSCQTPAPVIMEQMTPPEYFQAARDAAARRNHPAAMAFYQTYLERYPAADHPQETKRNLWAEYEIAFLYHKLGDDGTAIALLGALIAKYDAEGGDKLPQAPGRLAQRVIDELSPINEGTAAEKESGS